MNFIRKKAMSVFAGLFVGVVAMGCGSQTRSEPGELVSSIETGSEGQGTAELFYRGRWRPWKRHWRPQENIVEVAQRINGEGPFAGQFDTLIAAVLAADPLVAAALTGDGAFTVLAPTDDAFEELGVDPDNVGDLDPAVLTEILLYHVADRELTKFALRFRRKVEMLNGGVLRRGSAWFERSLRFFDAAGRETQLVAANVFASNGVIHAIDRVVLPSLELAEALGVADPNIVEVAQALNAEGPFAGQFDTLIAAVLAADPLVVEALTGEGTLTVFAPTDEAFDELGLNPDNVGELDQGVLTDILLYHVAGRRLSSAQVRYARRIKMLKGGFLTRSSSRFRTSHPIELTDNEHRKATVVAGDVGASNGVIHAIDRVVLPFGL